MKDIIDIKLFSYWMARFILLVISNFILLPYLNKEFLFDNWRFILGFVMFFYIIFDITEKYFPKKERSEII